MAASISREELQLASRNHGMPLEALRYDLTPVGLHYLLIHYDVPWLDPARWRLRIEGEVQRHLELSLADLRALPRTSRVVTMECAGNGRALLDPMPASQPWLVEAVGTGEWTGVSLAAILQLAQPSEAAVDLVFSGADRGREGGVEQTYERSLSVAEAMDSGCLLAYELNGAPLPPQHGFPLRLVVPGWYGMTNVKWLSGITALAQPFAGYQQTAGYRMRQTEDEPGTLVTRMAPRALMVPPGIPDFYSRVRFLESGPTGLVGRAWSGTASITRVEVSPDGGSTWADALLTPAAGPVGAWQAWSYEWRAAPGEHELCCRATDATGEQQPLEPSWNRGGYRNNAVQRVPVIVS